MGVKFRSGLLSTDLTNEETNALFSELESIVLPSCIPSFNAPLPESICNAIDAAFALAWPPLTQSATRLVWLLTQGNLPSKWIDSCIDSLMFMMEHGTILDQRFSADVLVRQGHVSDPQVLMFYVQNLGEVDTLVRKKAIQVLSDIPMCVVSNLLTIITPMLDHANLAVRSDALSIIHNITRKWRNNVGLQEYTRMIGVNDMILVVADGGAHYDAITTNSSVVVEDQSNLASSPLSKHDDKNGITIEINDIKVVDEKNLKSISLTQEMQHWRNCLQQVVIHMLSDWDDDIRELSAKIVADLELIPLVMLQITEMLTDSNLTQRRKGLKVLGIIRIISEETFIPFLNAFQDGYASIRVDACKTAHSLALCHSKLLKEILGLLADWDSRVRAYAVKALATVATGFNVTFRILDELIDFLEHELCDEVKAFGCETIIELLTVCETHTRTWSTAASNANNNSTSTNSDKELPSLSGTCLLNKRNSVVPQTNKNISLSPGNQENVSSEERRSLTYLMEESKIKSSPSLSRNSSIGYISQIDINMIDEIENDKLTPVRYTERLLEKARGVLIQWYNQSKHKQEEEMDNNNNNSLGLNLQLASERALMTLGVHVASLALDSDIVGTDKEVMETVITSTQHDLNQALIAYENGTVNEMEVTQLETALTLATLRPEKTIKGSNHHSNKGVNSNSCNNIGMNTKKLPNSTSTSSIMSVVTRRVRQLGTRTHVLEQLAKLDGSDNHSTCIVHSNGHISLKGKKLSS